MQALRGRAQEARAHGAYHCAPEELARSDAHLQFAAIELAEGNPARAQEHLVLADANARAALWLSADVRCPAARPQGARLQPRSRASLALMQRGRAHEPIVVINARVRALSNDAGQPSRRRRSSRKHAAI